MTIQRMTGSSKGYMDSLKASVLTAFYTPQPVIDAIAESLQDAGVVAKRFLEPSAGRGDFIDTFMSTNAGMEVMSFEKDLLTGRILSALHPSTTVRTEGFENIEKDFEGYFDMAASNIPFGDFAVADPLYAKSKDTAYRQASKAIHNYFFPEGTRLRARRGYRGIHRPAGVMNAASPFVRMELVRRADLVAALRLPNNTFTETAGTEAGSDLIVLQKHDGKKITFGRRGILHPECRRFRDEGLRQQILHRVSAKRHLHRCKNRDGPVRQTRYNLLPQRWCGGHSARFAHCPRCVNASSPRC